MFYITIIFNAITILEKVIFVQNNTYLDLYTSYNSQLPLVIIKLSQVNDFLFYIFLATFPTKEEIKMPMILFVILQTITILSGGRSQAVTAILFAIAYIIYREYQTRKNNGGKNVWIKKTYIVFGVILLPFVIAFLGAYNSLRNNIKLQNISITQQILDFFYSQGTSINILGYVKMYEDMLPNTNITYVFEPIIVFFREGIIGRILGFSPLEGNTVQMALYGNNLGATISYLVMPDLYLKGHGLGTQYIAELYADFGYLGIFLFNIFLGMLLKIITFNTNKKWYWTAICISIIRLIFFMPRDFTLSWTTAFYSITNWTTILLVTLVSRIIKKGESKNENTLDS